MTDDYLHGYSAAEMRRLTLMQGILNDAEIATIQLEGVVLASLGRGHAATGAEIATGAPRSW